MENLNRIKDSKPDDIETLNGKHKFPFFSGVISIFNPKKSKSKKSKKKKEKRRSHNSAHDAAYAVAAATTSTANSSVHLPALGAATEDEEATEEPLDLDPTASFQVYIERSSRE